MKKSRAKIACHDFNVVRELMPLTGIPGEWITSENHCQFRAENGAVLNYWKTTGTITFQGSEIPASPRAAGRLTGKGGMTIAAAGIIGSIKD
jgi:hypothetical protein